MVTYSLYGFTGGRPDKTGRLVLWEFGMISQVSLFKYTPPACCNLWQRCCPTNIIRTKNNNNVKINNDKKVTKRNTGGYTKKKKKELT